MSLHTLRQAALRLLDDGLAADTLTIVWHAGEPLAMPITFYEDAIGIFNDVFTSSCQISHSIQTNATLLSDAWCELFKKHDFSVGVSVDGPAHLHNRRRHTRSGKNTHDMVLRGMNFLRANGISFHAIAVVTKDTLTSVDSFFDFFQQHDIQEVSCNFDEIEGTNAVSSIAGNETEYEAFIARLMDRSIDTNCRIRIRELTNAYGLITNGMPTYNWAGNEWPANSQVMPFALITVAWDGDFCTFSPELLGQQSLEFKDFILGNVNHGGYLASSKSDRFQRLWHAVMQGTEACRQSCAYFKYCGGGAPANKFYENKDLATDETLYCRLMLKRPFNLMLDRMEGNPSLSLKFSATRNPSQR